MYYLFMFRWVILFIFQKTVKSKRSARISYIQYLYNNGFTLINLILLEEYYLISTVILFRDWENCVFYPFYRRLLSDPSQLFYLYTAISYNIILISRLQFRRPVPIFNRDISTRSLKLRDDIRCLTKHNYFVIMR